nr:MAG TPA: hypothetical protein [Caudoviricetes sp.]
MGKGRDAELIKKRDEALCRRYVYWTEVQRLRFDDVLIILSEQEFFISQERILSIIRRAKKLPDCENITIPKNKCPRLTFKQLSLFSNDPDFALEQIHRESRTYK